MRKAGDKPCGCQHSEPEVFQTIWKHLKSDGMPDQAANHMTAEMLTHGEDFESSIEQYERNFANYKNKGFNEHAAQAMAVESLEDGAEQPRESMRFAGSMGEDLGGFMASEDSSGEDIAMMAQSMSGVKPEKVYMKGQQIL